MSGLFITFEGIDGTGKSTQIKKLSDHFTSQGKPTYITKEPGGTDVGNRIREILLDKKIKMSPETDCMLYAAARREHVLTELQDRKKNGEIIISDRFLDSSFAYQMASGLSFEYIEMMNDFVVKNFMPDVTVLLKIDKQLHTRRMNEKNKDRIENRGSEYFEKVLSNYDLLSKKYKDRFIVIDATGEKEKTHENIIKGINERCKI